MNSTRHFDKSPLLNWVILLDSSLSSIDRFTKRTQMEFRYHEKPNEPNSFSIVSHLLTMDCFAKQTQIGSNNYENTKRTQNPSPKDCPYSDSSLSPREILASDFFKWKIQNKPNLIGPSQSSSTLSKVEGEGSHFTKRTQFKNLAIRHKP